jgi:arginine deiminase
MIVCGGGDPIHAAREQWNDGSNVVAIRPNEVIAYSRNHITNDLLRSKGVIVNEIPSSELSRGRGGPRCMSMPLYREDVDWALLRKQKQLNKELTKEFTKK